MAFLSSQIWYCGSTKYSSVAQWAATTSYAAGNFVRQLAAPSVGNERVFVCVVAGTSGGSEPSWTLTQGASTTDGAVTWIECTGKAGANGDMTNTPNWTSVKNTALSVGVVIQDNTSTSLQIVTTAGTTGGGSQPSFSTTAGVTTVDNGVTWTSLGASTTAWGAPWARLNLALATGFFVASGDIVYVSNNHAETQAATMSYNANVGIGVQTQIICVDDAVAPPISTATTGSVSTTGANSINIGQQCPQYMYGLNFNSGSAASAASILVTSYNIQFDSCGFKLNNTSSSSVFTFAGGPGFGGVNPSLEPTAVQFGNCNFTFGAVGQSFQGSSAGSIFTMKGGSIAATGSVPTNLFTENNSFPGSARVTLRDVNLSTFTKNIISLTTMIGGLVSIENCALGVGYTTISGTPTYPYATTPALRLHNSDSSATNYNYFYGNNLGSVKTETTIVRTGGATNGSTGVSWKFVTTANSSYYYPFVSEPIAIWNTFTSGSHTATLALTTNATLTNANCWIEVECLGNASYPLGVLSNTKSAILATPSTLTTDGTSTWGGGALTNLYKISCSFSPLLIGFLKVRIYTSIPSTTIYFDPLVQLA